jgi:hypothetical protein
MGAKGWGVVAAEDILPGTFVMEYIGLPFPSCSPASSPTSKHARLIFQFHCRMLLLAISLPPM